MATNKDMDETGIYLNVDVDVVQVDIYQHLHFCTVHVQ
jgi:hypothetical protein